jgi:hypothetical protein
MTDCCGLMATSKLSTLRASDSMIACDMVVWFDMISLVFKLSRVALQYRDLPVIYPLFISNISYHFPEYHNLNFLR